MNNRQTSHGSSDRVARRAVGALMLALFAIQLSAAASTRCNAAHSADARGALPELAGVSDMTGMDHDTHSLTGTAAPPAPAQERAPNCEHSLPVNGCSVVLGCLLAVPGATMAVSSAPLVRDESFRVPGSGPRPLEFAPDTPPPRA